MASDAVSVKLDTAVPRRTSPSWRSHAVSDERPAAEGLVTALLVRGTDESDVLRDPAEVVVWIERPRLIRATAAARAAVEVVTPSESLLVLTSGALDEVSDEDETVADRP